MKQSSFLSIRGRYLSTLILVLLLFAFGSKVTAQKKVDVDIKIVSAETGTGEMVLSPGDGILVYPGNQDTIPVFPGKKVTWSIGETALNVRDIQIERKKVNGSENIFFFFDNPPSRPTREGGGRVDIFRKDAVYVYSIHWTDTAGNKHTFDPKIAVKPSKIETLEWIILILTGAIPMGGLWFLFSVFQRKKAKRNNSTRTSR